MNTRILLYISALAMLVGPAVAGGADAGGRSPAAEGASVGFANLAEGAVVPPDFTVKFSISGMGIAPAGVAIDSTGHFHLLVDLAELPPMDRPLPASEQLLHFDQGQTEAELKLAEGEHSLQLLLADHAHVPHDPPVISDRISVTVSAGATPPDASAKR